MWILEPKRDMLLQERWVIPEMWTLNKCVKTKRILEERFPNLEISLVFDGGKPRLE